MVPIEEVEAMEEQAGKVQVRMEGLSMDQLLPLLMWVVEVVRTIVQILLLLRLQEVAL
jgi:hypothetical protein